MTATRAVLLVRISDDKANDQLGIARQEADCRALARQLGWEVLEVVPENDTSAFKRKRIQLPDGTTALRTVRPGFRRVLDMLSAGDEQAREAGGLALCALWSAVQTLKARRRA